MKVKVKEGKESSVDVGFLGWLKGEVGGLKEELERAERGVDE